MRSGFQRSVVLVALSAAVLGLSACQSDPDSLDEVVALMAEEAGTDVVSRLRVEGRSNGFYANAAFITDDGEAVQVVKLPEEDAAALGSPGISVPLEGVTVDELNLDALEQRLDEVPDCDETRAEILVLGEHVTENVRCSGDNAPQGYLDGEPVPTTPAGDLPTAAQRLADDAALLDATHVGRVSITMAMTQVWSTVQVVDPGLPDSNGEACHVLLTRSAGSLYPECELPLDRVPVEALDSDVITHIWEQEGQPADDWTLELVGGDDNPAWRAESGTESTLYTLDGIPR